jgi:hypothetical protein
MSAVRSPASPVRSRIYEKLIWDTLRSGRYDSFAQLVADVKVRCARLRVPYHQHEVDAALAAMGDKVTRELTPPTAGRTAPKPEPAPATRAEAVAALDNLRARLGVPKVTPKAMPAAPLVSDRQADRARAFAFVVQGIKAQTAVCRALEQAPPDAEDPECDR